MPKTKRVVKVGRKTNKHHRMLIGKKSKVSRKHRVVSRKRKAIKLVGGGEKQKVVLLIIDPQNDFSDNTPNATLPVTGATNDYTNIVNFINKMGDSLTEIHVSLDTHTLNHIGHKAFWQRKDGIPMDNSDTLRILSISEINIITGTSIIDGSVLEYVPANPLLNEYVTNYLQFFNDKTRNTHQQSAWIWPDHCIEGTEGHNVHPILQTVLDSETVKNKVKYHIKGQNNLAEMYSIFSAENPVDESTLSEEIKPLQYTGNNTQIGEEATTYNEVITLKNLNTKLNTELLDKLLGSKENPNVVFICGEAKTHCVKSSTVDLLDYATKNGYPLQNIILLSDATSPIIGVVNDIEQIVSSKGGLVSKSTTSSFSSNTPSIFDSPISYNSYAVAKLGQTNISTISA